MYEAVERALDAEDFDEAERQLDALAGRGGADRVRRLRARIHLGRGVTSYLAGRPAEALPELERAAELDPSIPNVQTYLTMARRGPRTPTWD